MILHVCCVVNDGLSPLGHVHVINIQGVFIKFLKCIFRMLVDLSGKEIINTTVSYFKLCQQRAVYIFNSFYRRTELYVKWLDGASDLAKAIALRRRPPNLGIVLFTIISKPN